MYAHNKIIVIDNFYDDPDQVREVALQQEYLPCNEPSMSGNWPGYRSRKFLHNIDETIFNEFRNKLLDNLLWNNPVKYEGYIETNFQVCLEENGDSWVHYDRGPMEITHVGVVYLNPNPPSNSGTIIYDFNEEHRAEWMEYSNNEQDLWFTLNRKDDLERFNKFFTENITIPNKYNRCIIYGPWRWHKSDQYFGHNLETGRMIQPFFCRIKFNDNE